MKDIVLIHADKLRNKEELICLVERRELDRTQVLTSILAAIRKDAEEEAEFFMELFIAFEPTEEEILQHLEKFLEIVSFEFLRLNDILMEYVQDRFTDEKFQEQFLDRLMERIIEKSMSVFTSVFDSMKDVFSGEEYTDIPVMNVTNKEIVENVVLEEEKIDQEVTPIVANPDIIARFPGEHYELRRFIQNTLKYPLFEQENGIQGRVICQFIINEDGSVSDIEIIEGISEGLNQEAIRIISQMPKWEPAIHEGKLVRMVFSIPLLFHLY